MTRRLLPFEHDLIETLGVSKEEYLEFIALQSEYNDPKAGTVTDIRNWETVAIVLTIVGVLFQVASALLMPKPNLSGFLSRGAGQRQTRDERFSPRFGFNATQELASYGDPINLVYANRGTASDANPNGGTRLTSSLLWSAVRSYGSSQFIQMLLLLSGGAITEIDPTKSAFGDTPIRDLIAENLWMYFAPSSTGALTRGDEVNANQATDPTAYGTNSDNPYRIQLTTANTRTDGFSQAYSPSSNNSCGLYGVVPLNISLFLRAGDGDKKVTNLGVTAAMTPWVSSTSTTIPVGTEMTVTLTKTSGGATSVAKEAEEARRSIASSFDAAGIFKLGTALFRVKQVSNTNTDSADMTVSLVCISAGRTPSTSYSSLRASTATATLTEEEQEEFEKVTAAVDLLLQEDQRVTIKTAAQLAASKEIKIAKYGRRANGKRYIRSYARKRALTADEIDTLERYVELAEAASSTVNNDDIFYTKALVRVAKASYETFSACHIIDFALKANVFKRINGRQNIYGERKNKIYSPNDNGIKRRVSMFKVRYKEVGQSSYTLIPAIFCVRRAADNDSFVYFKFSTNSTAASDATYWSFELEPVSDPVAETAVNKKYVYLENSGEATTFALASYTLDNGSTVSPQIQFTGSVLDGATRGLPPLNENPKLLNEWDLFSYDSDTQIQFSFDNGPEITITAVTEQLAQSFSDYTNTDSSGNIVSRLYDNLALFGFNAFSGKSLQDIRSFSTFVTKGRSVRKLRTSGTDENGTAWGGTNYVYFPSTPDGASSLAPDIFLDTILDKQDGIGNYAVINGVDLRQLAITKRFCIKNSLFMDCVIAEPRSWRQFWVDVAPFSLLEFARISGRETLVPAVPYDPDTGEITRTINISTVFNQGNILEGSYKEEYIDYGSNVQDIIASVIYTEIPENAVFPRKRSVEVKLADTLDLNAIRQTFDASAYITNRSQAILFGKLMCNTRRYVRQAVEFKTYPTSSPVSPGAYVYVDIGQNAWDAISTGIIGKDGTLNVPLGNTPADGTYTFRLYRSDKGLVELSNVVLSSGSSSSLSNYENYLFVLGTKVTQRRVFRVSEVQMDEDGETTVRATSYPCTTDGKSMIADFSDSLFTVRS